MKKPSTTHKKWDLLYNNGNIKEKILQGVDKALCFYKKKVLACNGYTRNKLYVLPTQTT